MLRGGSPTPLDERAFRQLCGALRQARDWPPTGATSPELVPRGRRAGGADRPDTRIITKAPANVPIARLSRRLREVHLPALFAALLWAGAVEALEPGAALGRLVHKAWTIEQGLPQNTVNDIVQTRDGYLWLATFGGLVRFDGVRFEVFDVGTSPGLGSNRLTALLEGADGALWIGSEEGYLSRMQDGRFTTLSEAEGLASSTIWDLVEDADGALWAAAGSAGVVRLHRGRARVFSTAGGLALKASGLALDTERRLWVSSERGLARWRSDRSEGGFESIVTWEANGTLPAVQSAPDGGVWASRGGVLGRWAQGTYRRVYTAPRGDVFSPMLVDRAGALWFGASGLRRRPAGAPVELLLPDLRIRSLLEDKEGNLWIGTTGQGLHLLREGAAASYPPGGGAPAQVITEGEAGEILIGLYCGGLLSLRGEALSAVPLPDSRFECVTSLLYDDRGRLWVGGSSRLARREDRGFKVFGEAEGFREKGAVEAIYQGRGGTIWVGTHGGLGRLTDDRIAFFTKRDGLVSDDVRFITETRRGDLWLGGSRGVTRFADAQVRPEAATRFTTADGLPHDSVRAIHEDRDGKLWFGTYGGGLARLLDTAAGGPRFGVLTSRNGLRENSVSRILEDDRGYLWLSGNRGVTRLARAEAEAFFRGEVDRVHTVLYGEADGMVIAETNGGSQPAGWKASDGRLWFPTLRGAVSLDPGKPRQDVPPPVVVQRVLSQGREVDPRGPFVLPPGQSDFQVDYAGLQLGRPGDVVYRYRLIGYDRDWVEVGNRRSAFYTSLTPGAYRLEVAASSYRGGTWSATPLSLEITLLSHVWQTWWFQALAGAMFLGLFAGVLAVSVGRVRRRARELEALNAALESRSAEVERFAYAMSHELKTPLVAIGGFLGLAQRNADAGNGTQLREDLGRVEIAARRMGDVLRDLLELLRAGRMIGETAPVALGEVAREALERSDLAQRGVAVEITGELPTVVGDRERLREVFELLLDNAASFTRRQPHPRVEIAFRLGRRGEAVLRVRDNGDGVAPEHREQIFGLFERLNASTQGTGVGLTLAKRIVELHGGRIWVESEGAGKGSTFCFSLPLSPRQRD
jgi:signal transduction histidine kinase/ligand-binding sensor domain-containing protein